MDEIFKHIRKAFDSLWRARMRGNSIEIITPFPAAGDKYVSVFIVEQADKYVVTDGGWFNDGVYSIGKEAPELTKVAQRIFSYFIDDFGIKRTKTSTGRVICFKSTADRRFIPNLVFEVANFISLATSTALIPLREEVERRNRFRTRASNFILDRVGADRFKSNAVFTQRVPSAKFGAIVKMPSKRDTLINFITGSATDYMISSYCKSNTMFDLIEQAKADSLVEDKIVIMDDKSAGYDYASLLPYFDMSRAKGQKPIIWSVNEPDLITLLN